MGTIHTKISEINTMNPCTHQTEALKPTQKRTRAIYYANQPKGKIESSLNNLIIIEESPTKLEFIEKVYTKT